MFLTGIGIVFRLQSRDAARCSKVKASYVPRIPGGKAAAQ
jgi:hypothetical protein